MEFTHDVISLDSECVIMRGRMRIILTTLVFVCCSLVLVRFEDGCIG